MAWMAMSIAWIAVYSGVDCSVQWFVLWCTRTQTVAYSYMHNAVTCIMQQFAGYYIMCNGSYPKLITQCYPSTWTIIKQ